MTPPRPATRTFKGLKRPIRCRKLAAERVCALVRQGCALRDIAAREGMPTLETLSGWLADDSEFRARYERARQVQSEIFGDDVVRLADAVADSDLAGIKLRIDARKWRVGVIGKDDGGGAGLAGLDAEMIERLEAAAVRVAQWNAAAAEAPADASGDRSDPAGDAAFDGEAEAEHRSRADDDD